jgi:hypothetical protein
MVQRTLEKHKAVFRRRLTTKVFMKKLKAKFNLQTNILRLSKQ